MEFDGTVLLVSHDRAFLNNVVTSTIVFENGGVREYVGGYDDWLRQRQTRAATASASLTRRASEGKQSPNTPRTSPSSAASRKLTFKERQELESLPAAIEQFEAEIQTLHRDMAEPEFYQQPGLRIAQEQARLKQLEEKLAAAFERWVELEGVAR